MISEQVRAGKAGGATSAFWLDEEFGPLAPRNVYGATKLEAERLCRRVHDEHGLAILVLRTGRFFPEEDDTHRDLSGENRKANEFLNRRLTVEDAADAHVAALEQAPALGFDTFILSAPPPFARGGLRGADPRRAGGDRAPFSRCGRPLRRARAGRCRPLSTGSTIRRAPKRRLGFRCRTDFAAVLDALRSGAAIALRPRSLLCLAQGDEAEEGTMLKRAMAAALGWLALAGMQAPPAPRAGDVAVAARLRRLPDQRHQRLHVGHVGISGAAKASRRQLLSDPPRRRLSCSGIPACRPRWSAIPTSIR